MPRAKAKPKKSNRHRKKPDPLALAIGERVKMFRKAREPQKGSFDAVVGETELGRGYVSELERGLVIPTVEALAKLAVALDVTLVDLVAVGDNPRDLLYVATRGLPRHNVEELLASARSTATAITKTAK